MVKLFRIFLLTCCCCCCRDRSGARVRKYKRLSVRYVCCRNNNELLLLPTEILFASNRKSRPIEHGLLYRACSGCNVRPAFTPSLDSRTIRGLDRFLRSTTTNHHTATLNRVAQIYQSNLHQDTHNYWNAQWTYYCCCCCCWCCWR